MKKILSALCLTGLMLTLSSGCAQLFDKDNTPPPSPLSRLPANHPSVTVLWRANTGSGANSEYLRLQPAVARTRIFTASKNGVITAIDRRTGKMLWHNSTGLQISAGVSTNAQLVLAGARDGSLIAIDQVTGQTRWQAHATSEILAPAATTSQKIIVKSIDGHITAFSAKNGKQLWSAFEKQPDLILRGGSAPKISGKSVYAGFDDGTLSRFSLSKGTLLWKQTIASPEGVFPIDRLVDIDSDPVISGSRIFAAAWQGQIAAVDSTSGRIEWSKPVSTYTSLAYDGSAIYLADGKGQVKAFRSHNGKSLWEQKTLSQRHLTGPALSGHLLVLGDAEGWVHWLDKSTGEIITRFQAGRHGIFATPLVTDKIIYILTKDGQLIACTMAS